MLPSRFAPPGQSSAMRKSRLEGKQSFLPKPRHAGSIDRLSAEMRRPSGVRSSSAEPPRATIGGRLSREASATKIPLNRRSRSQQGEQSRYGPGGPITPLRTNKYSRATTTPTRTPSEDRSNRNWQTSLDRALAFVTIKDQRPISNPAWQRSECSRVGGALAERGAGGALVRPLTIARFVQLSQSLLAVLIRDAKLNNDNYVTKVPHIAKLVLYPGVVSKSWLKTVNTLHAFPHALAFLAYLLDLVQRVEAPVVDEWLYVDKDELAVLRRDYLYKSWIRFQDPEHEFSDLDEEYLRRLRALLGDDEDRIRELEEVIKKYTLCLEDEAEAAARAAEASRVDRRAALLASLRAERGARAGARARADAAAAAASDKAGVLAELEAEIERANAESQQLRRDVESQPMSVAERARLLDDIDYATRVQASKRALAEQITKMLYTKESELALWQKKSLDSCMQYNEALIQLSAQFPHLAARAVDEKELMGTDCAEAVGGAVDVLRTQVQSLSEQLTAAERKRSATTRHRKQLLKDTRAQLTELTSELSQQRDCLSREEAAFSSAAAAHSALLTRCGARLDALAAAAGAGGVEAELQAWRHQEELWTTKLSSLRDYIKETRAEAARALEAAKQKRAKLVCDSITRINNALDQATKKASDQ
ncbi:uncharacterized protein LOC105384477 [Plutella xylostella]|uniref:uncharacterized protein LOC105384477 n=1 Tax=Plutella xylostella TaxID=51655 RepID=UPI0020329449|nr:uncharacterized protein LOC105384477 [Plutella xylostella]